MNLLIAAGEHCEALLEECLKNLPIGVIEADEIWTFVRKKQYHVRPEEAGDPEAGDQYCYVAFDPYSKLVAAHLVGRRDPETTENFVAQLQRRVPGRLHLCTDGFLEYLPVIDNLYGNDIDYAQVIKPDPPHMRTIYMTGEPDHVLIGTSYVERQQPDDPPAGAPVRAENARLLEEATEPARGRRALLHALQLLSAARVATRHDPGDGARNRRHVLEHRPAVAVRTACVDRIARVGYAQNASQRDFEGTNQNALG